MGGTEPGAVSAALQIRQDNELKHLAERDDYYGSGSGKVVLTLRVRFGCGVGRAVKCSDFDRIVDSRSIRR